MTSGRRRILLAGAIALAAVALVAIYALLDPAAYPFPKCSLKALTGLDCPGCGSQRAIHALLHGRVAEAWHYNAALFVGVPLIAVLLAVEARPEAWPRVHAVLTSRPFILLLAAAVTAWWIGRNIV